LKEEWKRQVGQQIEGSLKLGGVRSLKERIYGKPGKVKLHLVMSYPEINKCIIAR
jgi:hypothetical protein